MACIFGDTTYEWMKAMDEDEGEELGQGSLACMHAEAEAHCIERHRNRVVFDRKSPSVASQVLKVSAEIDVVFGSDQILSAGSLLRLNDQIREARPPVEQIQQQERIEVDGAVKQRGSQTWLSGAAMAFGGKGEIEEVRAEKVTWEDPIVAEALACRAGLRLAMACEGRAPAILSDCLELVQVLHERSRWLVSLIPIKPDLVSLLSVNRGKSSIIYVNKNYVAVAHKRAKNAALLDVDGQWSWWDLPEPLQICVTGSP
ncbi:hypothetical protein CDL15_Pgr010312 [Punica granatum]|uniref:Uncharacterized protein n=1 Tax=Punica granatum TaxID=22663 RepID=A0A218W343_PUNGR|nr:hypothetical protein CDL15_Pgr010312 [Punica granatum]